MQHVTRPDISFESHACTTYRTNFGKHACTDKFDSKSDPQRMEKLRPPAATNN